MFNEFDSSNDLKVCFSWKFNESSALMLCKSQVALAPAGKVSKQLSSSLTQTVLACQKNLLLRCSSDVGKFSSNHIASSNDSSIQIFMAIKSSSLHNKNLFAYLQNIKSDACQKMLLHALEWGRAREWLRDLNIHRYFTILERLDEKTKWKNLLF